MDIGNVESYDNTNSTSESQLVKIAKEFSIEQSVGSEFSEDFSFDTTVESETKVTAGGEEFGGSFEETLKISFGSHFGQQETETKEESTARTDSIEIEIEQPPGTTYFFLFSNAPRTRTRDFSVNGYLDWSIDMVLTNQYNMWWNNSPAKWGGNGTAADFQSASRDYYFNRCWMTDGNPGWVHRGVTDDHVVTLSFDDTDDWVAMFTGESEKWPRMGDSDCDLSNSANWRTGYGKDTDFYILERVKQMADIERRKIVLTGTQVQHSETAMTLQVLDLSDLDTEDIERIKDRADDGKPVDGDGGILTDPDTGARYEGIQHVSHHTATNNGTGGAG